MTKGLRVKILEEGVRLTTGDRNKNYGDVLVNHRRIAIGWSVLLGARVKPHQVALCMAWLKFARMVETPKHEDSPVDGATYTAIAGELAMREDVEPYDVYTGVPITDAPMSDADDDTFFNDAITEIETADYYPTEEVMEFMTAIDEALGERAEDGFACEGAAGVARTTTLASATSPEPPAYQNIPESLRVWETAAHQVPGSPGWVPLGQAMREQAEEKKS